MPSALMSLVSALGRGMEREEAAPGSGGTWGFSEQPVPPDSRQEEALETEENWASSRY